MGLPKGHLAISGDTFGCPNWEMEGATYVQWVEARDAGKYPKMYRTAQMLWSQCQQC